MSKNKNLISSDEVIEAEYGPIERDAEAFIIGAMLKEARLSKGMTQEELADKCGTTKAYISKVENNLKDVRISTLRNIVENGLNGRLQLSVQW
jgi:HTH-type transcriptional regulator/antitoxin HipB